MTQGSAAQGTEADWLTEIERALEVLDDDAEIFPQYIPNRATIGRPEGVPIGYLLGGARGREVKKVFDNLALQIAAKMKLSVVENEEARS